MASEDIKEALKSAAIQIRDEKQTGANTALRVGSLLLAICEALNLEPDELTKYFLRKDQDDRSAGTVASDKGFEIGQFNEGTLGSGASIFERDGSTYGEMDFLKVRKKATFTNITVQELKHVGGEIILSPAAMVCSKVEDTDEGYRCYFNTEDSDGRRIYNEFEVGDQARCQTFNFEDNTYYWRLVTGVGEDYIVLSKIDCDANSDIPKEGNNISQLGNRKDSSRQAAIILSAYGSDAPSHKQYKGINSYSLDGKLVTKLSPTGNELTGIVNIESGSTGASNLEDFPDEVFKAVHVGAVNLLLNSGFTGDFKSVDIDAASGLKYGTEMYSQSLKHWEGIATVTDDSEAVSGRSVEIGSLSQNVPLIKGESYVVSFKTKGSQIAVTCGDFTVTQPLSADYQRYSYKFVFDGSGVFLLSGTAKVCDIQLERGTIATDWNPSPYDNDKAFAEFQALKYMQDAIVNGSTDILGGLILTSMMQLGNYKDGKMQKVNAGVSGIYNDDNDVAFWGGGTFEQAIKTVMTFKQNPRYRPTDSEWMDLANFAVTHGGDAFFRGYIYALGGFFRGAVEIASGKILLNEDGSGQLANGNLYWTKEGIMHRKAPEFIDWIEIAQLEDQIVSYEKGLYFDLRTIYSDTTVFTLQEPTETPFSIYVKFDQRSRMDGSATLKGNFSVNTGDEYVSVDYIQVASETKGNPIRIDYESGTWRVIGVLARIYYHENLGINIAEIGFDAKEIADDFKAVNIESTKVASKKYSALVETEEGVSEHEGLSTAITVHGANGDHSFVFRSGLLVSHSYESTNGN